VMGKADGGKIFRVGVFRQQPGVRGFLITRHRLLRRGKDERGARGRGSSGLIRCSPESRSMPRGCDPSVCDTGHARRDHSVHARGTETRACAKKLHGPTTNFSPLKSQGVRRHSTRRSDTKFIVSKPRKECRVTTRLTPRWPRFQLSLAYHESVHRISGGNKLGETAN
jgi:hypothetical protein